MTQLRSRPGEVDGANAQNAADRHCGEERRRHEEQRPAAQARGKEADGDHRQHMIEPAKGMAETVRGPLAGSPSPVWAAADVIMRRASSAASERRRVICRSFAPAMHPVMHPMTAKSYHWKGGGVAEFPSPYPRKATGPNSRHDALSKLDPGLRLYRMHT